MSLEEFGVQIPGLLLPNHNIDHTKWAVIACDQFTSQPEYWDEVAKIVDDKPSTYHLTLPEIFLGTPEENIRLLNIARKMQQYITDNLLIENNGSCMSSGHFQVRHAGNCAGVRFRSMIFILMQHQ